MRKYFYDAWDDGKEAIFPISRRSPRLTTFLREKTGNESASTMYQPPHTRTKRDNYRHLISSNDTTLPSRQLLQRIKTNQTWSWTLPLSNKRTWGQCRIFIVTGCEVVMDAWVLLKYYQCQVEKKSHVYDRFSHTKFENWFPNWPHSPDVTLTKKFWFCQLPSLWGNPDGKGNENATKQNFKRAKQWLCACVS